MRIQAIELVGAGDAEQREQLRAHRVDGLGLGEGGRRAGRGARAELEDRRERRVAQARVDHARLLEQHQVAIRQLAQRRAVGDQQARGAALGEDQREHLAVGARAARELRSASLGGAESSAFTSAKSAPCQAHSASPSPRSSPKPARAASGTLFR